MIGSHDIILSTACDRIGSMRKASFSTCKEQLLHYQWHASVVTSYNIKQIFYSSSKQIELSWVEERERCPNFFYSSLGEMRTANKDLQSVS